MATPSLSSTACPADAEGERRAKALDGVGLFYPADAFGLHHHHHFFHLPRLPFAGVFDSPARFPFHDRRLMHDLYGFLFAQNRRLACDLAARLPVEGSNVKVVETSRSTAKCNPEMFCEFPLPLFKSHLGLLPPLHQQRRYQQALPADDSKSKSLFQRTLEQQQNIMNLFYRTTHLPSQKPFLELEGKNLWRQFHSFGTEMVITKNGRRMFPLPSFRVFGMELEENYVIFMDIVPVDQFRYKFQGASWTVAGRADPEPHQKAFVHSDSPCSGSLWMAKPISFNRLKLTNHAAEKQGYLVLNSMQKYQPRVHVVKISENSPVLSTLSTFVFEEMEFMAVTAYQNEKVTQLKIENNPFAKGFRISSDSKTPKKRPAGSWKQRPTKRCSKQDGIGDGMRKAKFPSFEIKKNESKDINSECSSDSEIDVG